MFSNLVGSTALSVRMDPEDLCEVISACQKMALQRPCNTSAASLRSNMGDGLLINFGYPEDDAERAERAVLELVAVVGGQKTHPALETRVGIATGLVVVGDLIGSGASQEQAIVGEAPNLAARLQGVAEPNSGVVALPNKSRRERLQILIKGSVFRFPLLLIFEYRPSLVAFATRLYDAS